MAYLLCLRSRLAICKAPSSLPSQIRWKTDVPEVNAVGEFHSSINQSEKGKIYDKKPFKFLCQKGKSYMWCSCGHSKTQPFCDGTHKSPFLKIKLRPVRFVPTETKEYFFCNCKQTNNRPFCDGAHRDKEIQAKIKGNY